MIYIYLYCDIGRCVVPGTVFNFTTSLTFNTRYGDFSLTGKGIRCSQLLKNCLLLLLLFLVRAADLLAAAGCGNYRDNLRPRRALARSSHSLYCCLCLCRKFEKPGIVMHDACRLFQLFNSP